MTAGTLADPAPGSATPGADALGVGPPLVLTRALLDDGRTADVRVGADGHIESVTAAGTRPEVATETAGDGIPVVDLAGWLLLTGAVEPHAHLDKALTADVVDNPTGDLLGAVQAWHAHWPNLTVEDIATRAEAAARRSLAAGITSIRTHVDLGVGIGLRSVEALVEVRARLADLVPIQIVALVSPPVTGPEGKPQRDLLDAAVDAGIDVIGGCPYLDDDPIAATEHLLETAGEAGLPIDLHTDETLEPDVLTLRVLADRVARTGFAPLAAASHCVSLGVQPDAVQREVADLVAGAGVSVVALPQTNLFLQARGIRTAPPRGLTAIAALHDAGVNVAVGADNLQDPFNIVGRADPFETAALLVMAGHFRPDDAWWAVTGAPARALGLGVTAIAPGAPADLLAVPAGTMRAAIADAPAARVVVRAGRVVARTEASTALCER